MEITHLKEKILILQNSKKLAKFSKFISFIEIYYQLTLTFTKKIEED